MFSQMVIYFYDCIVIKEIESCYIQYIHIRINITQCTCNIMFYLKNGSFISFIIQNFSLLETYTFTYTQKP